MKQISTDLIKLESDAAPDGWKCSWNRYVLLDIGPVFFSVNYKLCCVRRNTVLYTVCCRLNCVTTHRWCFSTYVCFDDKILSEIFFSNSWYNILVEANNHPYKLCFRFIQSTRQFFIHTTYRLSSARSFMLATCNRSWNSIVFRMPDKHHRSH